MSSTTSTSSDRSKAIRGTTVILKIQYYGPNGLETDTDQMPYIKITDANGEVQLASTQTGVTREDTGLYKYSYSIQKGAAEGLWEDEWVSTINGTTITNNFSFLVMDSSDLTEATGSVRLGDDVNFNFSDEELKGINILMKYLKCRLRSNGRKPKRDSFGAFVLDGYGSIVYEECNVFSDEILACFLCSALSEFNMIPFFTSYTFADGVIKTLFSSMIVEGAYVIALASQALVEKGRDFSISDGGINYQPPQLGDFLASQYNNFLSNYRERLKFVKNNIRPGPQGFGTFTNLASGAPAFTRLRHLRSRRII